MFFKMVVIHKDIFFANIPDVDHGECHLDLYLPDKLQHCNGIISDKDLNEENNSGDTETYDRIEEVKHERTRKGRNDNLTSYSRGKRNHFRDVGADIDETISVHELPGTQIDRVVGRVGVPFVLFIHGGGWRRGGRAAWKHYLYFDVNLLVAFLQFFVGTYGNIGEALAENKIACAVISYPLTEAGPVMVLAEMFLSYIQSALFVFLVCLPVLALLFFYRIVANTNNGATFELSFKENDISCIFRTICILAVIVVNILTSILFFLRRRQFNISVNQIRLFSVALLASFVAVSFSNKPEYVLMVLTLVINQSMIFHQRSKRHGSSYEHQTKAVAQAVRWAKCFSQETGHTDVNRLYLMGHSAGGHLATLLALDESILASVACSTTDLKGIISISGVYDLLCLNKHLLRPVYLEPTFGRNSTKWFEASPEHLATKTKGSSTMPKFLLMLAEKDLFLKSQSFKFAQTLEDLQYDCTHVEICKTNHFNIVTNTSISQGTTLSYVLDFVK